MIGLLVGAVLVSALQLIHMRQQNRLLFAELQRLQQQYDVQAEQWRQLQLEQSTWAQLDRIETVAQEQLNMHIPSPTERVILNRP